MADLNRTRTELKPDGVPGLFALAVFFFVSGLALLVFLLFDFARACFNAIDKLSTIDFSWWLSRDTQLTKMPGFVEFHLLKGPEHEDFTLYCGD